MIMLPNNDSERRILKANELLWKVRIIVDLSEYTRDKTKKHISSLVKCTYGYT